MITYINYPALLIWQGDDELSFASDPASLKALRENVITEDDRLVDSQGVCWLSQDGGQHWQPSGQTMPLVQLVTHIQAHYAQLGQCCVRKMQFKDRATAMASLAVH
ncbi:hypothetical protein BZG80_10600 [Salinivibrio sp. MA440]|uniref:DUF4144 family protein n=1 Tax=Salinivibrio sp. MA440 TaxID=1909456 RepID=UPI000988F969|nr:DUF4144 family protein [Salinivibrio sp. MA440]OOF03204.1 hypothetical protein BZG80_10600 [Salinivibrio sp. MA440]